MVENSTEGVEALERAMEAACERASKGDVNGAAAAGEEEVEEKSYLK